MGKRRLKEFDQSAQAHTSNQWSWNLNLGSVTPEPVLWSTAQIIPISSPKLCLPPLSADRKQKPPSRDRAHQISQTFQVDTHLLSSPVGGQRAGTKEITCVSPSLLCRAPDLLPLHLRNSAGSGEPCGDRRTSSSLVMTNPREEPSYFATQRKFPLGKDHSVFSRFLNSYQPRTQSHSSLSEKPLLWNNQDSFIL